MLDNKRQINVNKINTHQVTAVHANSLILIFILTALLCLILHVTMHNEKSLDKLFSCANMIYRIPTPNSIQRQTTFEYSSSLIVDATNKLIVRYNGEGDKGPLYEENDDDSHSDHYSLIIDILGENEQNSSPYSRLQSNPTGSLPTLGGVHTGNGPKAPIDNG